ncbi:MAG TPA: zinc-dependent alcohol dehydrogenase family protein [Thermodesulfovibrionales bacterium]|nr:zinc-dependent alcohol dehydrogenase family protein [Thermodesulfovibrionales bacterium]
MKAMVLRKMVNLEADNSPLQLVDMKEPVPGEKEILIKVSRCGVCHTELDEIEGRTPPLHLPVILGHQIVGRVERSGGEAKRFKEGDRIGIAWIHSVCRECNYCRKGQENLCDSFMATGRDAHGGYAEYTVVDEDFAYAIPRDFSDSEAAPLLCAGAIGYRSLMLTGIEDGESIGLTGFGASGHLVFGILRHKYPRSKVYVFSRTVSERVFAAELGAYWTGDTEEESPEPLRAVVDTTPAWKPFVRALRNLERGGRLVINAIRKEEKDKESLLGLEYFRDLWMEKEIKSVANITRKDVEESLALAAEISLKPEIQEFTLSEANRALQELKQRKIRGAKVLRIE